MKEVILGLDISTSRVGLCLLDLNNNLIKADVIKLDTSQELEERCIHLETLINNLNSSNHINSKKGYSILSVFIESPFIMFSGGKTTAATMSKLQRFNGMVSFMVRKALGLQPVLITANKARGLVGLKIKRGENTKRKVIEWVEGRFPSDFKYELTRYGNPKPGTDDRADAVIIAYAGSLL